MGFQPKRRTGRVLPSKTKELPKGSALRQPIVGGEPQSPIALAVLRKGIGGRIAGLGLRNPPHFPPPKNRGNR